LIVSLFVFIMAAEEGDIVRSFWAIELVPGKEYETTVEIDLHITQAVLPAAAKEQGRGVVSIKFKEEDDKSKEKSFAIASLRLDAQDSQALDVVIDEGSTVIFTLSGKNNVHLSGYYVPDSAPEDNFYGDDDDEIDSDELGSEGEDDEDDDLNEEEIEKANAAIAAQLAAKRKQAAQNGGEAKKAKVEAPQKQQQQQPKQEKKPQQQQAAKPTQSPQTKDFPNGLKVVITREGTGAEATKGRKVGVKYVGKLTKNGKVFDSSSKPFVFTLGARDVITGWDLGVAGMKVGEKRTLVIPSELGYGKTGAGKEIPPNSSLTFDVELLSVR